MKSKLFRLISLVLVMVMLINMLPMGVFAEQYRESQLEASIAAANVVTDAQITEEITSDQSEFNKVFRMDNGLALSATYTYTDDLLTSIMTGSLCTYTFTYGDFALREKISIGSRTLATYSYTEDHNKYLRELAYDNGDSVKYTYNDYGRVLTEIYE